MAAQTQESITLECGSLINELDKAAAKVENFSNRANKSIEEVDKAVSDMSVTQKRAYDVIKDSYKKHVENIKELSEKYEVLRQKQKSGADMSKKEKAELQHITGEYKKHSGAIISLTSDLDRMSKQFKTTESGIKSLFKSFDLVKVGESAVGGLTAIITSKLSSAVTDLLGNIASAGVQTQQTVSQFAAMKNNLSDATATYQIFNDVARDTNYDFSAVNEMGKQLLNMGYSAQNAAELIALCSDTAAGLGQGVEGAQQLVSTISRIQATGDMSSKQLVNLQMAGLDMDKVFASLGMTADQAMKALDNGTLDSQKAIQALTSYMHEFDGSMAKSKQNIIDQWGDVTGNIATACGEIGASIADAFMQSEIVKTLIDITQDFIDMIRGEGTGAFSDLKDVGEWALGLIKVALESIWEAVKLVIIIAHDMYAAFKQVCKDVVSSLNWLLEPLGKIYNAIKDILSSVGKGLASEIDKSWSATFKAPERKVDANNHFKTKSIGPSSSGGGNKSSISDEQKQVDALIKKYADASKLEQDRGKIALQIAGLNASMLVGEARQREELNNKIAGFTQNHDYVIKGYEKELELANKISDASTREATVTSIKNQIKAQEELFAKQVEAANWNAKFKELQTQDKTLIDTFFGNPESVQAKIDTMKSQLATFLEEVNAMQASSGEGGMQATDLSDMSGESVNFLQKMLGQTPEQLAEEFAAKQESFASFADFIKSKMAEATATETQNLSIGEQWKQKQTEWVGSIGKSMGDAVASWIMGAKSIGEAMKEMVKNLISQAIQLLAQWTMVFALVSAFKGPKVGAEAANKMVLGIGDWKGFATGGLVSGPGGPKDDMVPAMLSDGEYVLNASAVRAIGVGNLDAMNYGKSPSISGTNSVMFSGGVGGNVTLNVSTLDASSFSDFLTRGGLDGIKQAMFDDNLNFAAEAGIF